MTVLIVLAALVVGATVWFIAWPLKRPRVALREGTTQLVQLRDRLLVQLNELDVETGDRNMDPAVVADERRRVEAELAQTLKELERCEENPKADRQETRSLWGAAVIVLALAVPLLAGGLYYVTNRVTLAQLPEVGGATAGLPPMVMEMVARLEQRLAQQPDDPEGWARLGRAYQVLERWEEARAAYARAHKLAPNDAEILSAYAGFLVSENPGDPSPEAVALFRRLHQMEPEHPGALWVLGLASYNASEFKQAVRYWESLLKILPPGSEVEPQVRRAIDTARGQPDPAR
ncbi:cytochrome C biogenesis protein CcmI [Sulfurifustis variabilis]|uniref:Cytochrome C biogenesis protein CcmI n=1 Tax=Sulfurifustis variabilis TaxID=1675686 RepID=A0A1B4V2T7_9GAMM|nr:tetratricopeptide repeat protein [Sulfurifustis variabilis]BAU47675.1 cytochrome C biogenesis protein CcmI [Sulfurifustis variabilis]